MQHYNSISIYSIGAHRQKSSFHFHWLPYIRPPLPITLLITTIVFCIYVLVLFCSFLTFLFYIFHMSEIIQLCFFLSDKFHLAQFPQDPSMWLQMAIFYHIYVYIPHLVYPFIYQGTHIGCIHILTIVNNVAVRIRVAIYFFEFVFIYSLDKYLKEKLLYS